MADLGAFTDDVLLPGVQSLHESDFQQIIMMLHKILHRLTQRQTRLPRHS